MLKLIVEYLELIIAVLTSLGIIIGLASQLFKSKKLVGVAKTLEVYTDVIQKLMVEAENLNKQKTGEDKLNYVISRASLELVARGYPEPDVELIKMIVENIIKLSKKINAK